MPDKVLKVAISTPLNSLFDYLPPAAGPTPAAGQRVRVPFGRREQTGVIVAIDNKTEVPLDKLRAAHEILDADALLDTTLMEMLRWASAYYQYPPGEVFSAALPVSLRHGGQPKPQRVFEWRITATGRAQDIEQLTKKARVQASMHEALATNDSVSEVT